MHSANSVLFAVSVLVAGASAQPLDLGPLNAATGVDLGPLSELPSATPSPDLGLLSDLPAASTGAPDVGSLDLPVPTQLPSAGSLDLPVPSKLPDLQSLGLPSPTGLPDLGSLSLPAATQLPKLPSPADDLDLGFLTAPVGGAGATIGVPMMINYAAPAIDEATTIVLRKGTSKKQQNMGTLTTTAKGGFYMWTPSKTLPAGKDYVLEIRQGDHTNLSPVFSLKQLALPSLKVPAVSLPPLLSPVTGASAQATKGPVPTPGLLDFKTTPVRAPLPKAQALPTGFAKPLVNSTSSNATPTLSKTYVPTAAAVSSSPSPSPSQGAASRMGNSAAAMFGGLAAAALLLV